jgi:DNA repair photolyase
MAKEYSPYACNLYIGCSHCCKYCYAPHTLQRNAANYYGVTLPRKDVLKYLEKDLQARRYDKQIMLSFIGDVYSNTADQSATTRHALMLLNRYETPVAVLSKGGERMLRDVDVFQSFGAGDPPVNFAYAATSPSLQNRDTRRITVGTTLTFFDEPKSRDWGTRRSSAKRAVVGVARTSR